MQRMERERERERLVSILGRRRKRYANGFLRGEKFAPPLSSTEARDRPRGRIIFTEIKSKIRLALKCAPDRASSPRIAGGSSYKREKER